MFLTPVILSANMQDKKNRYYIVSALADTKVDLKGLYTLLVPLVSFC